MRALLSQTPSTTSSPQSTHQCAEVSAMTGRCVPCQLQDPSMSPARCPSLSVSTRCAHSAVLLCLYHSPHSSIAHAECGTFTPSPDNPSSLKIGCHSGHPTQLNRELRTQVPDASKSASSLLYYHLPNKRAHKQLKQTMTSSYRFPVPVSETSLKLIQACFKCINSASFNE